MFAGIRGTGDWGTDERPKNFREMILWENPNGQAPLTALMAKMKKESVDDPEFSWWEEKLDIIRLTVNDGTGLAPGDTAFVVDEGALALVAGDVLQVEPATEAAAYTATELLVVTSVTDDTNFAASRGAAGSTAATIPDNASITRIGSVFEEGSGAPDIAATNPTKLRNYTQIFKHTVGITKTADKTKSRTGNAWENDKKRKLFRHSESMEQAFFWGKAHEETGAGGKPRRFTGGLREFITTHQYVYTVTPTLDDFLDKIHKVFDYDANGAGNERLVYCGNTALNQLNKLIAADSSTRLNFDGIFTIYGQNMTKLVTPQGTFAFKTHPLFNTHARYSASMFVVNPKGLCYRPLRDTTFKDNIQANDSDSRKAQWLTEVGLEVHFESSMAYFGNFRTI